MPRKQLRNINVHRALRKAKFAKLRGATKKSKRSVKTRNVTMKGVRRTKNLHINTSVILPEGYKRSRKMTQKALAAKKVAPKLSKKSRNPFSMKGKNSMKKALETLGEGDYENNSS